MRVGASEAVRAPARGRQPRGRFPAGQTQVRFPVSCQAGCATCLPARARASASSPLARAPVQRRRRSALHLRTPPRAARFARALGPPCPQRTWPVRMEMAPRAVQFNGGAYAAQFEPAPPLTRPNSHPQRYRYRSVRRYRVQGRCSCTATRTWTVTLVAAARAISQCTLPRQLPVANGEDANGDRRAGLTTPTLTSTLVVWVVLVV